METQRIENLLNDTNNESSKFVTTTGYAYSNQNNTEHGEKNENDSSIKFETKFNKSNFWSDTYFLVTGFNFIFNFIISIVNWIISNINRSVFKSENKQSFNSFKRNSKIKSCRIVII